ncbi:cysteine hydrolase family protein [Phocicoccus pinnipedialis]|uniref:Isochorismatase family protein YecD n=1 Tax=Phocicoccus pinnipedialis TaxID=110845 RepID=A0A6V7R5G8_9BACL|nr:cysteine hydrolase family protein [Jeotgalicoccus pinnipedialis]MBP1939646.1 nicotinamidase-related amidase [Jeotgalicoccus pinnipedialis]CAD2072268.1 Isochorismatase family protein YecD [Jeotgalicoccus pinnipedialis]
MKEALLIVDMSNDFVALDGGLTVGQPAIDIVPYVTELAEGFLSEGKTVVISMDAHQENDPHFDLWPVHNVVGTEGQKPFGELGIWFDKNKEHENLIYSEKENYNAFFKTGLAELLRARKVEKVHVVGVTTDICDFMTVAGADAEGFKTVVHKCGVATFTDLGDTMLEHMTRCFHTEIV